MDKRTESMLNEMNSNTSLATTEFICNECPKCINAGLQKERDCSELSGSPYKNCKKLKLYVQNKTRKKSSRLFRDWIHENFVPRTK